LLTTIRKQWNRCRDGFLHSQVASSLAPTSSSQSTRPGRRVAAILCPDWSRVSEPRAAVPQLPVNNRPETGSPRHASFSTAKGWFFLKIVVVAEPPSARGRRSHPQPHALSCPHAEEPRSARERTQGVPSRPRCAASRSMRAHARPHASRRAHAHSVWRPDLAPALLRIRTSTPYSTPHDVKQPPLMSEAANIYARCIL
jgi:hypothetical protein